ncbi:hypothetical protein DFO73_10458 [Cytobacillus oceanisediminis]|uniref:Uncharacterized protein n=1 Tax=Cytobacillus oceanisediminis TaxID=665099 RepID=A0A2V3A7J5_9BACI|nr:hypothetical protein DFO73_10458 [Cytobacillus oceanisediminis]
MNGFLLFLVRNLWKERNFQDLFTDETEVKQLSAKEIKVINSLGDGLYAQHKELISLIYTDDGWKIHGLKWEYE